MLEEMCGAIGLGGLGPRTGIDPNSYGGCLCPGGVFGRDL